MAPLRRFTKYRNLPPELQDKIISYAMVPRILEFDLETTTTKTSTTCIRAGPVPTLLHVNRAIRKEAQRHYKLIAPLRGLTFQYINLKIDTIYIFSWNHTTRQNYIAPNLPLQLFKTFDPIFTRPELLWGTFNIFFSFSANSMYPEIKHIAIGCFNHFSMLLDLRDSAESRMHELLHNLPSVETLTLVYDNRNRTKDSPEKYEFVAATGKAKRAALCFKYFHDNPHGTQEECWGHDHARYLTNFENAGKQKDKAEYVKKFWEDNPEWKKPELRARSIVKKGR